MDPRRFVVSTGCLALVATACGGSAASATRGLSASSGSGTGTGNPPVSVTIHEAGSTLLFPLLREYVAPLHEDYPNITLAPAGGGSGRGIAGALGGGLDMGGSDAYLSNFQAQQYPDVLDVPIAISAQAVNYNLPGISDLRLTGEVLAGIYQGRVTRWNDPSIAALNPRVRLPGTAIVPVRRADSSGDTFIFTQFLTDTSESWRSGAAFGTTVSWPLVPAEVSAPGNPGMVTTCAATVGCVAYVGVSAEQDALDAGLGEALLQSRAGPFLKPTHDTITAAVDASMRTVPGDLRRSLIYFDGPSSYPIINFEYLMVNRKQANTDRAQAIRTVLSWAIDRSKGSSDAYLSKVDFVPLPDVVLPGVRQLIARVAG
jgi:phosphate transport system substrate-binding protein